MSEVEVQPCKQTPQCWRVERFDEDGSPEIAIFMGTESHHSAQMFARMITHQANTSKSTSSTQVCGRE